MEETNLTSRQESSVFESADWFDTQDDHPCEVDLRVRYSLEIHGRTEVCSALKV